VRIPADDVNFVRPGIKAKVKVRGQTETFEGRVKNIGPRADNETRTFPVEINIDNQGPRRLLPGMFARAILPVRTYPEAILIPRTSVLYETGMPVVFVADVERGIAHRHPITILRTFGSRHLVGRGLQPGDHLVVTNQRLLHENAAIRVVELREIGS
jgi:RND family efflux transporter MFP subunit